jgi:hypothetical protein
MPMGMPPRFAQGDNMRRAGIVRLFTAEAQRPRRVQRWG